MSWTDATGIRDTETSLAAAVTARNQTPSGNALQVQIGPGDIISNIPVVMDFISHQIHEGETYHAIDVQSALNATTVKYGITVGSYAHAIAAPHITIGVDTYNGTAQVNIYEGAAFTGGTLLVKNNKNRSSANTDATTIHKSVTSTDGTLIDSFYVGSGVKASGSSDSRDEWVLKPNTIYRVDVIGQINPCSAIVKFQYYADLGL